MKKISSADVVKKNKTALLVTALMLVLAIVLISLPVYEFNATLFTKRSGNTFVGDERYVKARAEVDEQVAAFAAQGYEGVRVEETVTERVNSKGETTSMIAFAVTMAMRFTGWDFMTAGLPSSTVLIALLACVVLACACALLGVRGSMSTTHYTLPKGAKRLRLIACFLALAALLLVPVFGMVTTHTFSREVTLFAADMGTEATAALMPKLDSFLYGGTAGDELADLLKGVTYHANWNVYALIPVLFVMLCALTLLCKGEMGRPLARGAMYLFVIAMSVLILYPFYVMFITGFRSNTETTDMYFLNMLPTKWIWSNMKDIIDRGVLRYLLNSIVLSTGATAIAMICGIPAAYAMARMKFKGKNIFLGFVIMSQMFSPVVLLVGISQLMNFLKLNDTIIGLMLINAAFNQAFAIWLLRGTFVSISSEMEQAACIDGCSTFGALTRILLPMAAPGIVTTLIFIFINAWNEYTISTVLISTPANKPITVGITQFSSFNMIEWQYLFASALLATIPVVILFMCIEKHLVAGLTSGGVKG